MSKPTILIMRQRYPCITPIKTDYEARLSNNSMLNEEIKKKLIKKGHKN